MTWERSTVRIGRPRHAFPVWGSACPRSHTLAACHHGVHHVLVLQTLEVGPVGRGGSSEAGGHCPARINAWGTRMAALSRRGRGRGWRRRCLAP